MTGDALVGTDLSGDHPIAAVYPVGEPGYFGALPELLPFYGTGNDEVGCGSCHDAHSAGFSDFLRVDNAGSALCTTCHDI